jgi:hypothetical protein
MAKGISKEPKRSGSAYNSKPLSPDSPSSVEKLANDATVAVGFGTAGIGAMVAFIVAILVPITLVVINKYYPSGPHTAPSVAVDTTAKDIASKLPIGANAEGRPRDVPADCVDRHKQCKDFARNNACIDTPGWMIVNCPASCNRCHLRDPKIRCQRSALNMDQDPIYKPGDMEAMFQRLNDGIFPKGMKYEINVWSTSPWVVTFENFLNDREVNALVKTVKKWERSTDVGSTNEIGETGRILSQGRTSSNSWCDADCEAVRVMYIQ